MSKYRISTATIARTAVLLLALTNQMLSALGKPVLPMQHHHAAAVRRQTAHRERYRRAAGDGGHYHRSRADLVVEE